MDTESTQPSPVRQLRVVVEAANYEAALTLFRDVMGMPPVASFSEGGDAEVTILDAGRATLEIANPQHKRFIDQVEAEGRSSPWIRLALEVDDSSRSTRQAAGAGAELVAEPRLTLWQSTSSRLDVPTAPGLQLTLCSETTDQNTRDRLEGFAP